MDKRSSTSGHHREAVKLCRQQFQRDTTTEEEDVIKMVELFEDTI